MKTKPVKRAAKPPSKSKALAVRRPPSAPAHRPTKMDLVLSADAAALLAGPVREAQESHARPLPPPSALEPRVLNDDLVLGPPVVPPKFSKEESAILQEEIPVDQIRVKPTGQVYLPHLFYTRWLNRAFGMAQWVLQPLTRVGKTDRGLGAYYGLYVRGIQVTTAFGEQDYHENNPEQSYGDAAEATNASALRRCCKHLGIGGELWDKAFNDAFLQDHCVKVFVEQRDGKLKAQFRRKVDPPFWNEQGVRTRHNDSGEEVTNERRTSGPPPSRPPAHTDGKGKEKISDPQKRRLWAIIGRSGRAEADVKAWLAGLGYEHTADIRREDYDRICKAVENPGPLGGREPGQEG